MTTFIHLSDIHFSRIGSAVYDLDADVRDQLLIDVVRVRDHIGTPITGTLVTGDIAFSGNKDEYDRAVNWLKELAEKAAFESDKIWTTPGNHDVDRAAHSKSSTLQLAFEKLRKCEEREIDPRIATFSQDRVLGIGLYEPLAEYNNFALQFSCNIDATRPTWQEELPMQNGRTLVLLGLNSVLVSTKDDSKTEDCHKMILPESQCTPPEREELIYLSLCHHPTAWLRNAPGIESALNSRVHVQLFGHEHSSWHRVVDGKVQIFAGALHPENDALNLRPHYNIIQLSLHEETTTTLKIKVYGRSFDKSRRCFSDGSNNDSISFKEFKITLPKIQISATSPATRGGAMTTETPSSSATLPVAPHLKARKLLFGLVKVPFPERMELAKALELLEPEDENVPDLEKHRRFITRAQERKILHKLWNAVSRKLTGATLGTNPFTDQE